ncbi:MAG: hypothetical protein HY867_16595 [Chloroflexi bacterium]|nr:hypothetical protein [Chloroflexota bacterium]
MKTTQISRGRKTAILTLSVICIFLCGFLIWLSKYSSIYPIGEAKLTGYSHPIWSPDGTYIALYCGFSYPTDGWDERSFDDDGNSFWRFRPNDVCIVDLKTRQLKRITYGRDKFDLIMSPDGSMLSWWDRYKGALVVYDVMSEKTLAKVKTFRDWREQFWSLDGRRIVSSCGNAALDINSKEVTLTPSMLSSYVALSPNEKYLAFTQKVRPDGSEVELVPTQNGVCDWPGGWKNDKELLVISKDGGGVFKSEFYVYGWPFAWSPDSSLFIVEKETNDFGTSEMAIVYVPTGEAVSLEIKGFDLDLYWSPSGNKIAYKTFDKITQKDAIKVIEIEFKTNPFSYRIVDEQTFSLGVKLGNSYESDYLTWSPDEKHITFFASRTIWILNLETGEIEPLLPEN